MKPEIEARLKAEGMPEEDWPYLEKGMSAKASKAQRWIQANKTDIGNKLYEEVAAAYPGDERAFMFAWCEEFGGI